MLKLLLFSHEKMSGRILSYKFHILSALPKQITFIVCEKYEIMPR